MLAVDPFTQQTIRYYNCSRSIHGYKATIPRTNVYKDITGDSHIGAVNIDPGLQDAINSGIYSPGGHVTPDCATGNCSFSQPYNTLAYCGSCTDLTDQVKFNTSPSIEPDIKTAMVYLPSGTHINTSTPDISQYVNIATMNTSTVEDGVEFLFLPNPAAIPGVLTNEPNKALYSMNSTCNSENGDRNCKGYGAASCTIKPCVRTYTGAVYAGFFDEKWVAESTMDIWSPLLDNYDHLYLGSIDTECISLPERQ